MTRTLSNSNTTDGHVLDGHVPDRSRDHADRPLDQDRRLAHSGSTELRLAATPAEKDAALALRYQVFYEEHGAVPSDEMARTKRDFDRYDEVADHLLVIDTSVDADSGGRVVGTYRLMRRPHAARLGGFYTESEYDISKLIAYPGEILELGRSCVHTDFRNRSTMQLLWQGIAAYVFRHDIKVMFGCASMPGTDVAALSRQLSYLHHFHMAPEDLRPKALLELYVGMDLEPAEGIDAKRALASLPPLVKGYLRLGGFVGDGAVVDRQFNTTDVCVIVQTDAVTDRYFKHYERETKDKLVDSSGADPSGAAGAGGS